MEHRIKDCPERVVMARDQFAATVIAAIPTLARGRGHAEVMVVEVYSGATRSFILIDGARELGISVETSRLGVTIRSPLGDSVVVDRGFDVFLGIDWLIEHRAKVDYEAKLVTLCCADDYKIVVVGQRSELLSNVVSTLGAEKLVRKGYKAYLAYILNTDSRELRLDEFHAVCDFSDVFPKELPCIPLGREVMFGIELYPGTALVSTAPYCIEPKALKELKLHLQESLDRGFIQPSVSPWGASVLFLKTKVGTLRLCIDYRQLNK
ncbi:DNA/RNA polymerases superfamily protein [Gossypium australe]|uniref:DNA/RNA polymerases superfamily protein n=1 Tax=Gossypium australe TaxID=47621 RepID=A0A5B6VP80_9ROSI|nr:DNA/RNA polymerases superfamily protein [Gossypium australe]